MAALPVLSSCLAVVEKSQQVRINPAAIPPFVKSIRGEIPPLPQGPAPYHYFDGTLVTAQWIFVLDILNHCFWPDAGSAAWKIHYKGEILSGYWALAASLTRAMEEKIPIHRAETLAVLNRKTVDHIFRGRGEIPLLDERLANLQQAGQVLLDRFQGNFLHVLEEARGSATQLVLVVTAAFPSFNDTAAYRGKPVYFYKRAQLLTLDLWCAFSGKSWGALEDLDQLTAFADYKLPQVLRHLDIIRYTPELSRRIDNLVQLAPGSPEEVEIRLATIRAVELIRQELAQEGNAVTCAQLDNWLWTLGQRSAYRSRPYHRTRTVFY